MIDLHIGAQTFDFDCGAKALQMIMAYYGVEVREDELIEALGTGVEGTATTDMVAVAQRHGFQVKACSGWTLPEVKRIVNTGVRRSSSLYWRLRDELSTPQHTGRISWKR